LTLNFFFAARTVPLSIISNISSFAQLLLAYPLNLQTRQHKVPLQPLRDFQFHRDKGKERKQPPLRATARRP